MSYKKKLIEVALPLEAINKESAREKSIRHGHPSTLHLWWARRPLAACRAVLFASMVDDPSEHRERFPTEADQERERQRLFRLIEDLVKWENINNEQVLEQARREIRKYAPNGTPPPVLDPFAGGGSIPLEAQRLGLEAHAGDLNPVAVLINKALIEIPPKFAGQPPVNPAARKDETLFKKKWKGAEGLAEDVRYYGQWMRDEAKKRIGHLYPKVTFTAEMLAQRPDLKTAGYRADDELTVIAWLWTRTVPSPNPVVHGTPVPLVRSFWLSKKKGKQAWIEPVVDLVSMTYRFEVRTGQGTPQEGTYRARQGGVCLLTGSPIPLDYLREMGRKDELGAKLLVIVAAGNRGRIYLNPDDEHERIALSAQPKWKPDALMPDNPRWFSPPAYGIGNYGDLFTDRQLVALTTFSDLVGEARARVCADAEVAGHIDLHAYADAVATYLGMAVSKLADAQSSLVRWKASMNQAIGTFGRQALPMVWDYVESNPFAGMAGDYTVSLNNMMRVLDRLFSTNPGTVTQTDATSTFDGTIRPVIFTDPPYYDNIGYADLSDFFYVWLRKSLGSVYPELFATLLTPKANELIASPYRHDRNKKKAQQFFETGLGEAFHRMREGTHPEYPVTVYYAFKQAESDSRDGVASTGWETMLAGMIDAGFSITGTWPMRTELSNRNIASGANALASSIVLVCRLRPEDASRITRRDFLNALKAELPKALKELRHGNIAPVDLAQASIGPGMAVFSRYRQVLEADGSSMTVRTALRLINQGLDEFLTEQEAEYDADTRWALAWYEQYAFDEAPFGDAEILSKAKNTAVSGMVEAGILAAKGGKVHLLSREDLPEDWHPATDRRLTVWETTQYLIRALEQDGESGAAQLLAAVRRQNVSVADAARDLAYRLYTICERKKWAKGALAYNSLVIAWPEIERLTIDQVRAIPVQGELGL